MSEEQAAEIARLMTALRDANLALEQANEVRERHRLDIIEKLETIGKLYHVLGEIGITTDQITEGILRVKKGEEYA